MYRLRASTWQPVEWGFIPSRVILKTLQIVFAAFAPGARHKRKCEGFCVCVVRHVMSLNSVQSFVIENCNGPTIENGLNNVCLHPLSRTFYLLQRLHSHAPFTTPAFTCTFYNACIHMLNGSIPSIVAFAHCEKNHKQYTVVVFLVQCLVIFQAV